MIRALRTLIVAVILVMLVNACGDVDPYAPHAPITDPAKLFMRVTIDHSAINMSTGAPYNTLQLTATPLDAKGHAMSGLPQATFTSSDTSSVWVSPEGLLTARNATTDVTIIAEIDAGGNVRHTDTAYVNVTSDPNPPQLATFSIDPVPPDSNKWNSVPFMALTPALFLKLFAGMETMPELKLRALDVNGNEISGLAVEFESLTPNVLDVDRGGHFWSATRRAVNAPELTGQATFVVRTTAYGVALADTATFTILPPLVQGVTYHSLNGPDYPVLNFNPSEVTIRRNGFVFWMNYSATQLDVVFDDPAVALPAQPLCDAFGGAGPFCESGNIEAFGSPELNFEFTWIRGRQFTQPGTYRFHNTETGFEGRIIVLPDPAP